MPPFSMYYYLGKYLLPFTQENYYHSPGPTHTIKALKHCPRHPITLSLPSTELFTACDVLLPGPSTIIIANA